MPKLTADQIFAVAITAGFTPDQAVIATAVALAESDGNVGAWNQTPPDDSMGLWQINLYGNLRNRQVNGQPLDAFRLRTDPVYNAQAALGISGGGTNWRPWTTYTGGAYQRHLQAATVSMANYSQGGLDVKALVSAIPGVDITYVQGVNVAPPNAPAANAAGQTGPTWGQSIRGGGPGANGRMKPPSGGFLMNVEGNLIIMFNLGPGVDVYWDFSGPGDTDKFDFTGVPWALAPNITFADLQNMGAVHGGLAAVELSDVSGDLKSWVDQQITILLGGNSEAAKDPEVRKIFLNWAVNPQISEAEVTAQLKGTKYWQSHTQAQLDYNDQSAADQQKSIDDWASRLAQSYFDEVGTQISIADPTLRQWAMDVASGARTSASVLMNDIRPIAERTVGSPWYQRLQEQTNTIENTTTTVRDLYGRWGIPGTDQAFRDWGERIANGQASQEDLLVELQAQAKGLYPTLPPGMTTSTWAAPYLSTYQQLMETPDPGLFAADIQQALSSGLSLTDFRKQLMRRPEWQQTQNGQDTMNSAAMSIGRQMGFV